MSPAWSRGRRQRRGKRDACEVGQKRCNLKNREKEWASSRQLSLPVSQQSLLLISLGREGPIVSGQFQGLPEASVLFSPEFKWASWEDGMFQLTFEHPVVLFTFLSHHNRLHFNMEGFSLRGNCHSTEGKEHETKLGRLHKYITEFWGLQKCISTVVASS